MFVKKKKTAAIRVMHYEGIAEFATDYPCTLELKEDVLEIIRIKPETTVTLPRNRIKSISVMGEPGFMLKYHSYETNTAQKIAKTYLVIEYDEGYLAFWGTGLESLKFQKIFKDFNSDDAPTTISL